MPESAFDDVLQRALNERDERRRRVALRELHWLPSPSKLSTASESLLETALRGDDIDARIVATEAVTRSGDAALPLLGRLVGDPATGIRRLAVDALGLLVRPAALPLLERASIDESHAVRAAALDGIARLGTEAAVKALRRTIEDRTTPPSVALAALLGVEQLQVVLPASAVARWLDDPLTCGATLRWLGRAGDIDATAPSLLAPPATPHRAAVVGLSDALERGAKLPAIAQSPAVRDALRTHVRRADWGIAAAALIVLGYTGDDSAVVDAADRDDRARLLPALHRHVELLGKTTDVVARLQRIADEHPAANDIIRELIEAAQLRLGARSIPRTRGARPAIDDETFHRLVRWFESRAGLLITQEARSRVEARLAPRLDATGLTSFTPYVARLDAGDIDEGNAAIEALTVHETYFFRERATLDAFSDEIVPALAQSGRRLQVWSAGCSTGEEAYTLAALLERHRLAGTIPDYVVWGTDISPASIERAEQGRFGARSFRDVLDGDDGDFFVADGAFRRPSAALRERVRFAVSNLVDGGAVDRLPQFDVIFCRNVLIYLSTRARACAVDAFHAHLVPGGVLFLGHSESLLHVENPFEPLALRRTLAYRRSTP